MAYFRTLSFSIKCDKCGKTMVFKNHSCFCSEKSANYIAIKLGWSSICDKHICPKCNTFESKNKRLITYQLYDKHDERLGLKEIYL